MIFGIRTMPIKNPNIVIPKIYDGNTFASNNGRFNEKQIEKIINNLGDRWVRRLDKNDDAKIVKKLIKSNFPTFNFPLS